MDFQTILADTRTAYEKKEFFELLTGQKDYKLQVVDVPIDVPTDWTRVIPLGIHALYRETQEEQVLADYVEAISRLISGTPTEVWIAAYVLFVQISTEYRGKASFILNRDVFPPFHKAVEKNRAWLEKHSYGRKMSMYEDIIRLNKNLMENHQTSMLP